MRLAAPLVVVLGLISALAGIAVAVIAFAPIPFADSIDFFRRFFEVGGWQGYGPAELYARHNEHRLVVPRLWFLLDLALFDATQASLIVVTVLSSIAHAAVLAWVFRCLGHRGAVLWAFAAAALGATLSPAQWENLVWSFQVQFIQVWLFATLAFAALALGERHGWWARVAVAIVCGLASTYSMANGILVWPLLVVLAIWLGVRGGPLWLLLAAATAVIGVEAANYHAHAGHGDPLQTIRQPVALARYALRYLTSGVAVIGRLGQELLGGALVAAWAAFAVHALLRRDRYTAAHGVLIVVAGFVVGAALLTALGRVTFGLGQANAARYATPSLVFMTAVLGLVLARLSQVESGRTFPVALVAAGAILLVPGLVDGGRHLQAIVDQRNARADAVVAYASAGYRPGAMLALYPAEVPFVRRVLEGLDRNGLGPFADRSWLAPPPGMRAQPMPVPEASCEGRVTLFARDAVLGSRLTGWASASIPAVPRWVVAVDEDRRVVAWGVGHFEWRRLGKSLRQGVGRWTFDVSAAHGAAPIAELVMVLADGKSCRIDAVVPPAPGG